MLSVFRSKNFNADKFEKHLKDLSRKILSKEKALDRYQKNKSHYKKASLLYLVGLYLSYVSYLYFSTDKLGRQHWVHVLASPLAIVLVNVAIERFYSYLIAKTSRQLESLREQHQDKISELKEKTNFDKTNELLNRFSNGEDLKELESEAQEINKRKQEYLQLIKDGKAPSLESASKDTKTFYDQFFNLLLGSDELGPDMRYALICKSCFQHNGLAPKGVEPDRVKHNGIDHVSVMFFQGLHSLGTRNVGLLDNDSNVSGVESGLVDLLIVVILSRLRVSQRSGLQVGSDGFWVLWSLTFLNGSSSLLSSLLGGSSLGVSLVQVLDLGLTEHDVRSSNRSVHFWVVNGQDEVALLSEGDSGDSVNLLQSELEDELSGLLLVLGQDVDFSSVWDLVFVDFFDLCRGHFDGDEIVWRIFQVVEKKMEPVTSSALE
ncbi:hypothetical protein OGAPHI_000076 [Ogataea philodendri]|uniref:Endoplasmic reticulum junction formation protein lunapark n=1 Tax=Ogataea philodendri TaxID=1378263 RepID=A0A9P8PI12_9ASCO|nr:uncharacterized protein OGAPHI_000076 [Ogataea philodendri]KAH3671890.1 hypothetical protein OGAPHI_000076 [Ogataea philodendri]